MIIMILAGIAGFAIAWRANILAEDVPGGRPLASALFAGLGAVLGGVLALLFGMAAPAAVNPQPDLSFPLVALRSSDAMAGNVLVFATQTDFVFYIQDGAAIRPERVPAGRNVYIFEEDRPDGVFEKHHLRFASEKFRWLILMDNTPPIYYFRVPFGTVDRRFEVR